MGDGLVTWLREGKGKIGPGRLNLSLDTLRQGGWMLVATVVAGTFFYLSNVLVGRMLGSADYGIFASLNSFSQILAVVTGVAQTVVANYAARLQGKGAMAEVGTLIVYLLKRLLPWGIGGALMFSLVSRLFSAFLRIPSTLPVIVVGLSLIPIAILPAVTGALRGLQRFGALGATQISAAVFRLMAAVGSITVGLGATGAVASLPLSSLGAFVLGLLLLGDVLRQREPGTVPKLDGLFEYSFHAALVLICFAVLINGDVIIVKSRFSPTEAGRYSAVATLGKVTLWLSGAVVMLLLPKATEQHARGQLAVGLVRKSLLAVGLLCGSVTAVFFLFPSLLVRIFFGEQYLVNSSLLGLYGLAMTLYSLVYVWQIYYLAVQEKRYTFILLIGAVSLVISLALFGSDLTQVVIILVGIGIILYLSGEALLLADDGRRL